MSTLDDLERDLRTIGERRARVKAAAFPLILSLEALDLLDLGVIADARAELALLDDLHRRLLAEQQVLIARQHEASADDRRTAQERRKLDDRLAVYQNTRGVPLAAAERDRVLDLVMDEGLDLSAALAALEDA